MRPTLPLGDSIFDKIEQLEDDGCWLWTASTKPSGYGQAWWDGKAWIAHRLIYEALVGPIPDGLELDHRCRVRNCVRPDHLEPVTHSENVRRGEVSARQKSKTHCPQGHLYDDANTMRDGRGRRCRTCHQFYSRRYWASKKAAA